MANTRVRNNKDLKFNKDIDYKYPTEMNLHPDSEEHQELLALIMDYTRQGSDNMSVRHPAWEQIDKKLNVTIDLSAEEIKDQSDDDRRPVSMVVPISYTNRETLLTYRMGSFLLEDFARYDYRDDPATAINVLLLQADVKQQMTRRKMMLDLYSWWRDEITYGFGAMDCYWIEENRIRSRRRNIEGIVETIQTEEKVYQGNEVKVLDPYNTFCDNSVPITRVEEMQYFGSVTRTNYYDLFDLENDNVNIFNVKYLDGLSDGTSTYFKGTESHTGRFKGTSVTMEDYIHPARGTGVLDVVWVYVKLIPAQYGLSKEERPRIYKFGVAADRVIIMAFELDYDFNHIPIAVIATNSDDHAPVPTSILEIDYPMQHAIDWLWAAHVINVRKHLNNMIIYDPQIINPNDMTNTKYGMMARVRGRAFGKNVRDAVMQLNLTDVTRGHVNDIGFLMNMSQRSTASTDQMQGIQNRKGERVSASEARDTRLSNLSRLNKDAQLLEVQGHYNLKQMFASNTVQYRTDETFVKIHGNMAQTLKEEYGITETSFRVSPEALDVPYDILTDGGALEGREMADTWIQLLQLSSVNPELYQQIDFTRAWLHVARLLGAKDARSFLNREPRIAPDSQVEQAIQSGNSVPINEFEGAL